METPRQIFERTRTEALDAMAAGDRMAEADARGRMAFLLAGQGSIGEGAEELRKAIGLINREGDLATEAKLTYGLGLMLTRDPEKRGEARKAFERASLVARFAEQPELQVQSLLRMASLDGEKERYGDAAGLVTEVIRVLEAGGDPAKLSEAHRMRATFRQAGGSLTLALQDLDAALTYAEQTGDPRKALQVRFERRVLRPFVDPSELQDFRELADEAGALGADALRGAIELQRAAELLRADAFPEAQESAQAARDAALQSNDVVVYVTACMLIAEARENLGDRAGVIEILLTCKATLEQHLGKAMGKQIVAILDTLADRWGPEAVMEARLEYRRRMAGRPPQA